MAKVLGIDSIALSVTLLPSEYILPDEAILVYSPVRKFSIAATKDLEIKGRISLFLL